MAIGEKEKNAKKYMFTFFPLFQVTKEKGSGKKALGMSHRPDTRDSIIWLNSQLYQIKPTILTLV